MSGRIALMVRGLPSIGIDEAADRFGKYYKKPPKEDRIFHESPSFIGTASGDNIYFTDAINKSFDGGSGLTLDKRKDLRQMQNDFFAYAEANPNIYTNSPTSDSRAKLYRRVGFQQAPSGLQVLDKRIIAEKDLPYVKALDASVLPKPYRQALGANGLPAFIKNGDNVISISRLGRRNVLSALREEPDAINALKEDILWTLADRVGQRRMALGS